MGGKGKGWGKGGAKPKHTDRHDNEDPAGSCRVFVYGFDFGTTDEQLEAHMGQAGAIHAVHWVNHGKCTVVYSHRSSSAKAQALNKSVIDGNQRFITVIAK